MAIAFPGYCVAAMVIPFPEIRHVVTWRKPRHMNTLRARHVRLMEHDGDTNHPLTTLAGSFACRNGPCQALDRTDRAIDQSICNTVVRHTTSTNGRIFARIRRSTRIASGSAEVDSIKLPTTVRLTVLRFHTIMIIARAYRRQ